MRTLGQILVWIGVGLAIVVAATWAGLIDKAAVFDGIVESTSGGFMFPDATVQTTAATTAAGAQRKNFYVTDATFQGAGALTACANC